MRKDKKYRFIGILVISLAVLTLISFAAIHKFGSGGFSFSREERFFLNGMAVGKTADELESALGQPDYITEYAGIYVYHNFKLSGMMGELSISFRNGQSDYSQWVIEDINTDDYQPQINRLTKYFNKNFNQTDTWDWRKDNITASITGIRYGNFINVFFEKGM